MEKKELKLKSLEEAKIELDKLKNSKGVIAPQWSIYKIIVHCTQTIEYSMTGYPKLKPALIRSTVGKVAVSKFLKQGYMKHSLTAPVSNAPVIEENGDTDLAFQNLYLTIEKFKSYEEEMKPHLLFGKLSKMEYDQYFAMHIADHLSELEYTNL